MKSSVTCTRCIEPPEGDNSPAQVYRRNLMQDRNNLDYSLLHFDGGDG